MRQRLSATPLPWLGGLLALYLLVPVVAFASRVVTSHDRGFGTPGLLGALYVSVVTATISTAVIAVLGIPLAYALARSRRRLSSVVWALILLPLAMPPLMSGIVLVELVGPYTTLGEAFGRHLTESMIGIVLAQTFVASPFLVASARAAFAAVDPAVTEHAATLGRRELVRFWRVSLPLAWPGIRAGLVLSWLRAFGEYGATVILAYHPSTLPVYTAVQFSSAGIPTTQAPTALALGVAVLVGLLGRLPRRRRRVRARDRAAVARAVALPPGPATPVATPRSGSATPVPVAFRLDTRLGTFPLRVGYEAATPHLALLGPSGSGKSATLRGLAGLLGPAAGTVRYGDRCVDGVAVEDRRIGYVPQGYGLFPHLTVWRQVVFGAGASEGLAAHWLARLGLGELGDRYPDQLSGGQRQRVSLAQALARSPELLLLDEPFSSLDTPVRHELRAELRRLQRETAVSTVLVTHDPEEAAYLADEVVVVHGGRVLQAGPTRQVLAHPASADVARIVGVRNLGPGTVRRPGTIDVPAAAPGAATIAATGTDLAPGTAVLWCIRPEDVVVSVATSGPDAAGGTPAVVVDRIDLGARCDVVVRLAPGCELVAAVPGDEAPAVGAPCRAVLPPDAIRLWPVPAAAGTPDDPGPRPAPQPVAGDGRVRGWRARSTRWSP